MEGDYDLNKEPIVLSEIELVMQFGTKGQKASYDQEGHFIGNNKRRLLDKISSSYNIEELNNRRYRLTPLCGVGDSEGLSAMKKAQNNLYKYICPLILQAVLKKKDYHLILSCHSIARTVELINEYYKMVEFNKDAASRCLNVEENTMYLFYGRVNSMVDNFITKAIKYLWEMKIVSYDKIHLAQHLEASPQAKGRKIHLTFGKYIPMTAEEERWYDEAALKADKECGIEHESIYSRYIGKNAKHWKEVLDEEMGKHNIVNAIWGFDVRISDMNRCKEYLKLYKDDKEFPRKLSLEFRKRINSNVKKQYEMNPKKYKALMIQTERDFLDDYEFISKVVIDQTAEVDDYIREYQEDLKKECTKKQSTYSIQIDERK